MTIAQAMLVVLLLGATGAAKGADGGLERQQKVVPGSAPGAFLGPLPASKDAAGAQVDHRYPLTLRPDGSAVYDSPEFSATVAPDGTVTFHDHRLRYQRRDALFRFDLSDEFARELGHGTLYRYQKANFLADTFRLRMDMAARAQAARMRVALQDIAARLDALWADTRYRRRERRRIIFLLWAEADQSTRGDHSARAIIEDWIRRRLPAGSSDGYSKAELETLSHERRDLPAFSPYPSPLEMRTPR